MGNLDSDHSSALFVAARGSDEPAAVALAQLASQYDALVHRLARLILSGQPTRVWTNSYEDAIQGGRIGLLTAIRRFEPARGVRFTTYAWPFVRHAARAAVAELGNRETPSQMPEADDAVDGDGPESLTLARERNAAVRAFLGKLADVSRETVVRVYWNGESAADIARDRGVSPSAVSQSLRAVYSRGRAELTEHAADAA